MDYETLERTIKGKNYKYSIIGKSVTGRNIYCVRGGNIGNKKVLLVGALHAREYITADLIMRIFERQNRCVCANFFVVPMLNPDGVNLCKYGINSVPITFRENLTKYNAGNLDFSMWKANVRGVDINNNFDAGWHREFEHRKAKPASQGYYGKMPESEPETRAIVKFIRKLKPDICIAFHTKGEELYFEYYNRDKERDRRVAEVFAQGLGYAIKNYEQSSSAGLKDWCVEKQNMVAFTLECGADSECHPIRESRLDVIYEKFKNFYQMINESVKLC